MNIIKSIIAFFNNRKLRASRRQSYKHLEFTMNAILAKGAIPKMYERNNGQSMACGLAISRGLIWGATSDAAVSIFHARQLLESNKRHQTVASIAHA